MFVHKGLMLFLIFTFTLQRAYSQEQEAQQLMLNVEKLAQMKSILEQLKSGYEIVSKGYLAVRNISEGSFDLHQVFLDGLLQVSPTVRNYHKVALIAKGQVQLVKSCTSTLRQVKASDLLQEGELDYIAGVVNKLMKESLKQLESLSVIITSGSLRMSDEERLSAIDRIWEEMQEQQTFLKSFASEAKVLLLQRSKQRHDLNASRALYGK
jgi:hypothetical protein